MRRTNGLLLLILWGMCQGFDRDSLVFWNPPCGRGADLIYWRFPGGGGGADPSTNQTFFNFSAKLLKIVGTSGWVCCTPPPPPCLSYALVQATVGVGTVLIWYLILIRYQI